MARVSPRRSVIAGAPRTSAGQTFWVLVIRAVRVAPLPCIAKSGHGMPLTRA
jgi:hypothetical protein